MPILLALGPLELALAAVLGVLLVYGTVNAGHWFAALVKDAPVIGSWLAGKVEAVASFAAVVLANIEKTAAQPVIALLSTPARVFNAFVASSVAAARHLMDSIVWVTTQLLPSVGVALTNEINSTAVAIERWIGGSVVPAIDTVIGTVQSQLGRAYDILSGQQSQITAVGAEVDTKAGRDELAATNSVVGQVQTQVAGAYNDIAGQNLRLTSIGDQVAAIPGYVDTQVGTGVRAAEGYTDAGIAALAGTLSIPISQALTLAQEATTFVDECGAPMCDWWHNNGSGLLNLLNLVGLAELAALIGAGIADPTGTAKVANEVIGEFEHLGDDVLSLLGLDFTNAG